MFSLKSIVLLAAAFVLNVESSAVPAVAAAPLYAPAHVGYTRFVPQNIPPFASQISVVNRAASPLIAAPAFAAPLTAPIAAAPYAAAPLAASPYIAAPAAYAAPTALAAPAAYAAPAALAAPAAYAAPAALAAPAVASAYTAAYPYGAPLLRAPIAAAAFVR